MTMNVKMGPMTVQMMQHVRILWDHLIVLVMQVLLAMADGAMVCT